VIFLRHKLTHNLKIRKADKIIVMQKGEVVEQGNHESLLNNPDGAYSRLVAAQQLNIGTTHADDPDLVEAKHATLATIKSNASGTPTIVEENGYKPKGFINSFGLLLREQKTQFVWYLGLLTGCLMAASAYPLQAYILAKIVNIVVLPMDKLQAAASKWSLFFFVLALGVAAAYFIMGSTANVISVVSPSSQDSGHMFHAENTADYQSRTLPALTDKNTLRVFWLSQSNFMTQMRIVLEVWVCISVLHLIAAGLSPVHLTPYLPISPSAVKIAAPHLILLF